MPGHLLAIQNVTVGYGSGGARCLALSDATVSFSTGLTLVTGPSGSGKTTLLSLLGCLLRPDCGKVYVGGREVTGLSEGQRTKIRRESIGFVFQAFRLLRSLTALENVMIAGDVAGRSDSKRARKLLDQLGLGGKFQLKPDQLSGGEKQRVAIARALLRDPRILLADEPTASLDTRSGEQIAAILQSLANDEKRTVVVVSHDPRWESFAHQRVALSDGRVVRQQTKPLIERIDALVNVLIGG
ncbi:MAG: ABC transporter ATP-binding protein [Acidobacteria bacterium]|nr:ABC transporter ATP-binding protein [Acidobacteriota bacterium]